MFLSAWIASLLACGLLLYGQQITIDCSDYTPLAQE